MTAHQMLRFFSNVNNEPSVLQVSPQTLRCPTPALACLFGTRSLAVQNKMQSKMETSPRGAATWRTRRNIRVVSDYGPFGLLYESMTSSTKPEVHNVSHCRQRMTEPWPQIRKFGRAVFEICEQTDRQTD